MYINTIKIYNNNELCIPIIITLNYFYAAKEYSWSKVTCTMETKLVMSGRPVTCIV